MSEQPSPVGSGPPEHRPEHLPEHLPERVAPERVAKLEVLRERGIDPYPVGIEVTDRMADLLVAWAERLEPGEESSTVVSVGGRLVAKRGHGRLAFLVLRDGADELQALCALDALGEDGMALVELLDTGDWVVVRGPVVRSKRGELSVGAREVVLVGKSLRAMPDKWHGLSDVEQRYRQREVDLAVNADSRRVFEIRAATLRALRTELAERGFVEVETPVLQTIPGGANARPFATHHHALGADLYLRIALELHLKRLVAGGMPRVFEIGRVFRNEGLSTRHNPEFTMLESYEAFADYRDVMELTQALVQRAAVESTGGLIVTHRGSDGGEEQIDLGGRWPRRTVVELVAEALGRDVDLDTPVDELRASCDAHGVAWHEQWGAGRLIEELRDQLVEPTLRAPTFVLDYPVEVSPLARRHRNDPRLTERFELIVAGRELANAFSELTDPAEQRARFELQAQARAAGDDEAMVVDEPFLRAMEFGMPPMGGLGVGIDRLVMLLAGVPTIRDVVLFPTLRPER